MSWRWWSGWCAIPDGRVQFHYVIVDYLARWASGELQPSEEVLERAGCRRMIFPQYQVTRGTSEVSSG